VAGMSDLIKEPEHYKHGSMETIEEMELIFGIQETMIFCKLNAWKYRARALYKGTPEQDMQKANQYLLMYDELSRKSGVRMDGEQDE
jgi:hypothetical protein